MTKPKSFKEYLKEKNAKLVSAVTARTIIEISEHADQYAEQQAKVFAEYYRQHVQENYHPSATILPFDELFNQFKEGK